MSRPGRLLLAASYASVAIGVVVSSHEPSEPKALVVTGLWNIKSKAGFGHYKQAIKTVLTLNSDIAVYGDAEGLEAMESVRGATTPSLVGRSERAAASLPPCNTHPELFDDRATYSNHSAIPSVELGCLWDGKISLLAQSARQWRNYDYYVWLDVGLHCKPRYWEAVASHKQMPWPSPEKLAKLPTDKMTVARMATCDWCPHPAWRVPDDSGFPNCGCISGTTFVIPRAVVFKMEQLFYAKIDECLKDVRDNKVTYRGALNGKGCLIDQTIFTELVRENPDMFHYSSAGHGGPAGNLSRAFGRTHVGDEVEENIEYTASRFCDMLA